jgi:hypothetical protein
MSKAGTNEFKFETFMKNRYRGSVLNGKVTYGKQAASNISVDNSIEIGGKKILIEIDSGNMAKLLAGQYTLLNLLCNEENKDVLFIVIHYYKDYNPERTVKNLKLINEKLFKNKGIKFKVFHINQFKQLCNSNKKIEDLIIELYKTGKE